MKPSFFVLGVLLAPAVSANADSWSSTPHPAAHRSNDATRTQAPSGGVLQAYFDLSSFSAAVGDIGALAYESFDGGSVSTGSFALCDEPLSSASNDLCFLPGELIDGFDVTSSSGSGVVTLGSEFFGAGQTTAIVGANTFLDSTVVTFASPANAFSMDLYDGVNAAEITLEAFDAAGVSLGAASATPLSTDAPAFLGIVSNVPVARIVLTAASDGGELLDNLRFDVPAGVPDDTLLRNGFDAIPIAPGVAKSFEPSSIVAGTTSVLTIVLSNPNPTPAVLLADLVDAFPAGLALGDPTNAASSCSDAAVATTLDSVTLAAGSRIPANDSCEITVEVTSNAVGVYTNTIDVGALQTNVGDNDTAATADISVPIVLCVPAQLLQDPGFEQTDVSQGFPYTNPFWIGASDNFGTPFCDSACGTGNGTAGPHSGAFFSWLGGANNTPETAKASQTLTIPSGSPRFLNFWLWIGAIGDGSSNVEVAIDGAPVFSFPEPVAPEADYSQRSIDLSAFADDGTHTIAFTYTNPSSAPSNYSLDDVTLDCLAAPATPQVPAITSPSASTARIRN